MIIDSLIVDYDYIILLKRSIQSNNKVPAI